MGYDGTPYLKLAMHWYQKAADQSDLLGKNKLGFVISKDVVVK
jgi:TPR repeat protein